MWTRVIKNGVDFVKIYRGLELIWQKISELLHLTSVKGNSVQEPPNLMQGTYEGGISSAKAYCAISNPITSPYISSTSYYRGVATYFKAKPNTTYIVSGNVEGNRYTHVASYTSINDIGTNSKGTSLGSSTTFTTLSNTEYIVVAWTNNAVGSVITFSDIKAVEDAPPSPTTPIEIKSVGDKTRNLFNKNATQIDSPWTTTGYKCIEIPVESGTYYAYGTGTTTSNIYYYLLAFNENTSGTRQVINYFAIKNSTKSGSFVINEGERLFLYNTRANIVLDGGILDELNIMISKSSVQLPFEPYGYKLSVSNGTDTSTMYLSEPLRKIGDYSDELKRRNDGSYYVERLIYEDSDSATKPMSQGLHLLDTPTTEEVSWDAEPTFTDVNIEFLTEIQPSDYTLA